ncbi:hypothetical protein RJ55_04500 [Drechmeria coniospora]|nr:hypothetical protein RJ55_04500 [Drechmeria coniospora]
MTTTYLAKAHNYNFALEKYMLLQEQHEELSHHLQRIRPHPPSVTVVSTRSSSLSSQTSTSTSPALHSLRGDHPRQRRARAGPRNDGRRSLDLDTIVDEDTLHQISAEEKRLSDVNESIKRALTELLNCDAVRSNNSMRMWAQARLMETEKELRTGRRRKGAAPGGE